jgi:hypothetical protein
VEGKGKTYLNVALQLLELANFKVSLQSRPIA